MNTAVARPVLVHALLLGVLADALLRDGPIGIAFPLWIAALGVSIVALVWRVDRLVPPETRAWLVGALLFSVGLAWRHSGPILLLDVAATAICLGMAAVSLADPAWSLTMARMRDAIWAGMRVVGTTVAGVVPVALRTDFKPQTLGRGDHDTHAILRAVAISAGLVVIFGSLLAHADPIFASFVALPDFNIGRLLSHIVVVGFFSWIVAGWARSALMEDVPPARAPEHLPFSLGVLDVTMALGALDLLFATYVAAQLSWFFGGEEFLRAQTGLTASAYARRGFFELVWVAALVVPLLLGTRAALQPDVAVRRRHTALSIPLVVLLGAMMGSAVLRMHLYVEYFGLTEERLYPLVFMAWLGVVLVLLVVTVLRDRGRLFVAGVAVSGFATLAALNVANPDAIIARVNLGREQGVDLTYLSKLGGEAVALAAPAVIGLTNADGEQRCTAARHLLATWGPTSPRALRQETLASWRGWNAGERRAMRVIRARSAALREVVHATCARRPATAQR